MTTKPPSVGDSKTHYKKIQEVFELPKDRQNVVTKVERILAAGGVQKLVIELGQPIRVDRLIKSDEDVPEPQELADDDLMNNIRNGEIYDFPQPPKLSPFMYLFQAFHILSQKRLVARTFMVHSVEELRSWLKIEGFLDLTELYGVEVVSHPQVPDFSALLIAENFDALETPSFSIRLTMDEQKEVKDEANRGEGSQERNSGSRNGRAIGKVGKPT